MKTTSIKCYSFSASLIALLVLAMVNLAFAAQVLQLEDYSDPACSPQNIYDSQLISVADTCVKKFKFTCSPFEQHLFNDSECSGTPYQTIRFGEIEGCSLFNETDAGQGSMKVTCLTAPDNRIANVLRGDACSVDGKVTGSVFNTGMVVILDECYRSHYSYDLDYSYKLNVVRGTTGLNFTYYIGSRTCEGEDFTTIPFETGVCKSVSYIAMGVPADMEPFDFYVQIIPAIDGVTLEGQILPSENENDDDDDDENSGDKENDPNNKNNAAEVNSIHFSVGLWAAFAGLYVMNAF